MVATELSLAKSGQAGFVAALAGLVTGFLTPLAQSLVDQLDLLQNLGGIAMALGGIPFAALVVLIVRTVAHAEWSRALLVGLATLVAFEIAILAASNTTMALRGSPEALRNVIGGAVGGFIGGALMAAASRLSRIGPPAIAPWLPMIGIGTVLGALLAVDMYRHSDNVWVLFPVWQASIALILARLLSAVRV